MTLCLVRIACIEFYLTMVVFSVLDLIQDAVRYVKQGHIAPLVIDSLALILLRDQQVFSCKQICCLFVCFGGDGGGCFFYFFYFGHTLYGVSDFHQVGVIELYLCSDLDLTSRLAQHQRI